MSASSASAIIDLGDQDLQFTETTPPGGVGGGSGGGTTHTFDKMPDSAVDGDGGPEDDDDRAGLLGGGKKDGGAGYNFWSPEFYRRFFDVDDAEVGARIRGALLPVPGRSFLAEVAKGRPDLWGPLWICATLVVSVAVTGNLASYLQSAWVSGGKDFEWHYDFHKVRMATCWFNSTRKCCYLALRFFQVTLAAAAVFSYAWLVPAGVYGFLWWTASGALASGALGLLDLLCLYGYSLAVYVPVSVLWLIQNSYVQWALAAGGAALSGGVVVMTLWPALKEGGNTKGAAPLILVVVGLQVLLACGFMLYFFHVPSGAGPLAAEDSGAKGNASVPAAPAADGAKKEDEGKEKSASAAEGEEKKNDTVKRTVGEEGGGGGEGEAKVEETKTGEEERKEKSEVEAEPDSPKEGEEVERKAAKEESGKQEDDQDLAPPMAAAAGEEAGKVREP